MDNLKKSIKDLKERNHKLQHQSREHEIREIHYLYKCEQLEKENEKLKEELKELKSDYSMVVTECKKLNGEE